MSDSPSHPGRRAWLSAAGAGAAWRALGMAVPYARFIPAGLLPVVAEAGSDLLASHGKPELRLLNDRPISAETPAHLLDDAVTPASRHFVRNNGLPPSIAEAADDWQLRVHGESCPQPAVFTVGQLKARFKAVTLQLQLECGGNGRAEFRPRASGNQWTTGAIGCAEWTGIRVGDLLDVLTPASQAREADRTVRRAS